VHNFLPLYTCCNLHAVGNALQKVRMPQAIDATSTQTRNCSAARRNYILHLEYMRTIVCWGFKLSSWGCYIACFYITARTILSSPCLQPTGSFSTLIKTTAPTGLRRCPTVLDVRISAVGLDGRFLTVKNQGIFVATPQVLCRATLLLAL
jgi:hypothetical protein